MKLQHQKQFALAAQDAMAIPLFPPPLESGAGDAGAKGHPESAFILVVEDSRTQAARLRLLLEGAGYKVEIAPDGEHALERARGRKPDLVIADIVMPNMDGYGLCAALKREPQLREVGVLLLTSLWEASDIVRGLQSGADYYLTKPYNDDFLLQTVKAAVVQSDHPPDESAAIEIELDDHRYSIGASRLQMLHLLLSTYGNAVQQNRQLLQAQSELQSLNSQLKAQRAQIESQRRELEERNARLQAQATRDSLTGLRNHRALQERLREEIAAHERGGEPLSLLLLDVDNFKGFNDGFGHPAGDEVLRRVAVFMEEQARANDLVARYGGEEFVILLPRTDREASLVVAERVRAAIEGAPWRERAVTASLGVSTALAGGDASAEPAARAEVLLARADEALYRSKAGGRNRVTHWADLA